MTAPARKPRRAAQSFELVGIAHHAPACAAEVTAAIERVDPDLVCVQLPRDAAPLAPALRDVTRFPVALFGHGSGAQAWLPLTEHAPELAALRAPCEVALVDVPLEHAIEVGAPAWSRLGHTCDRLGRGPGDLVERLCDVLGPEVGATLVELAAADRPSARDRAIATAIREAAQGKRRIVVVVGAAHGAAITALLDERTATRAGATTWRVDLVPYDDARLHRTGAHRYPRWTRVVREADDREHVIARIAALVGRGARNARVPIGPGEEAEAVALAIALARLRDSRAVALDDLLDAIRLVMVGDRAGPGPADDLSTDGAYGPIGPILARVLVGGRRGAVPAGTAAVPIVADYRARLAAAELAEGVVRLDIYRSDRDRARSHLLHQLGLLEVPGAEWRAGPTPDGEAGAHLLFERWQLDLGPAAEDALTEHAARGATLRDATTQIVHERIDDRACTMPDAVAIAIYADRMGLDPIPVATVLDRPARLVELGVALARLAGEPAFDALAVAIADRAIHALSQHAGDPPDDEILPWLDAVHAIYVHARARADARDALVRTLEALRAGPAGPVLLGLTTAMLHDLGRIAEPALVDTVRMQCFAALAAPAELGRFVLGVALPAPTLLARVPGAIAALDAMFAALDDDAFLAMVPELRLACSTMPTYAIAMLIDRLAGTPAPRAAMPVDVAVVARLAALHLAATAATAGVAPAPAPLATSRDRWRMILGEPGGALGEPSTDLARRRTAALDALDRLERGRGGAERGHEPGAVERAPEVLAWLAETRRCFPPEVAGRLHDQAIHRYQLRELLLDPQILRELEPSPALASALLAMRGAASPEVVEEIRRIVAAIVRRVRDLFERKLAPILSGARRMRDRDALRTAKNFDLARTLRKNLRRFDPKTQRLRGLDPVFTSRHRRRATWTLILLVDRSGSMASSVIDTTVLAGVFASVPALKVHLVLFDTEIADVTAILDDPVELLLSSSPAGGTDLRRPLAYASTLVTAPRRTLVVMLSDLFHNGPSQDVVLEARNLLESGAELLALTALSARGGDHDHHLAHQLREHGARVTALEPDGLARWLATRLRP